MSIVIVGSINVDITTRSEKLPRPGETLHGDSYSINLGVKAAIKLLPFPSWAAMCNWSGASAKTVLGILPKIS